ncbi:caveolae-associated protein 1 isoform X3 [Pogoniulus pusillus]|uniref:caveolae-associated protein 1 isoform X3 n=1 Tax=Pogoniulus pusillus TaxID=488313 RepID=UPI0030B93ACE
MNFAAAQRCMAVGSSSSSAQLCPDEARPALPRLLLGVFGIFSSHPLRGSGLGRAGGEQAARPSLAVLSCLAALGIVWQRVGLQGLGSAAAAEVEPANGLAACGAPRGGFGAGPAELCHLNCGAGTAALRSWRRSQHSAEPSLGLSFPCSLPAVTACAGSAGRDCEATMEDTTLQIIEPPTASEASEEQAPEEPIKSDQINGVMVLTLLDKIIGAVDQIQVTQTQLEERQQEMDNAVTSIQGELTKLTKAHTTTSNTVNKMLEKVRKVSVNVKSVRQNLEKQAGQIKKLEANESELLKRRNFKVMIYQMTLGAVAEQIPGGTGLCIVLSWSGRWNEENICWTLGT